MNKFAELKNEFERLFPSFTIEYRNQFAENDSYYCYKFKLQNSSSWLVILANFISDNSLDHIIQTLNLSKKILTNYKETYIFLTSSNEVQVLTAKEMKKHFPKFNGQ